MFEHITYFPVVFIILELLPRISQNTFLQHVYNILHTLDMFENTVELLFCMFEETE
jgi:hypothetical protein